MLVLRGLIVYETKGGKYVVIGGNMRLRTMRELGTFDKAPCIIIPPDTPVEKLKTYTVLDHQQAGDWDWTMITGGVVTPGVQLRIWNERGAKKEDEILGTVYGKIG